MGYEPPSPEILQRIGTVASEFSWIELLTAEMLSHFLSADSGSMKVLTQSVSNSTITDWIRVLVSMKVHPNDPDGAKIVTDLLQEVDDIRAERNTVVHGMWTAGIEPGIGNVQTMKWERSEVIKTEVWSITDLDDLILAIHALQHRLGSLGLGMGFLKEK